MNQNQLNSASHPANKLGQPLDFLTIINKVEVRNEERITAEEKQYCEELQANLYSILDNLDKWYGLLKTESDRYKDYRNYYVHPNGKVNFGSYYIEETSDLTFRKYDFMPFEPINSIVELRANVINSFGSRIIRYFNEKYNIEVPVPEINKKNMQIDFRPDYNTYIDMVISHLGGKSFHDTAVEELLSNFQKAVKPGYHTDFLPEVKGAKITFSNIIYWDTWQREWHNVSAIGSDDIKTFDAFMAGIGYAVTGSLNVSHQSIIGFDSRNVDTSKEYSVTFKGIEGIKFFKNRRIDIRFTNADSAKACFEKLGLKDLVLPNL